ncbi:MAG: TolC family protein [bacterium]
MNSSRMLRVGTITTLTLAQIAVNAAPPLAQSIQVQAEHNFIARRANPDLTPDSAVAKYADPQVGSTVDQLVSDALEHNGELRALRKEVEAAQALVKQARLRANPMVDVRRKEQIGGTDNDTMVAGSLPLELGGRRSSRIAVAELEVEVRERELANSERLLSAAVRVKFGEALAAVLKLGFDDDLVATSQRGYSLVAARVTSGGTAPLEQNMVLVELNRLKSMREVAAGNVEILLFELRNLIGMLPEQPMRLRGDFDSLVDQLPTISEATGQAIQNRPDLQALRVAENLSAARIEQARAGGRIDAALTAQYERMDFSFPQRGLSQTGQFVPIRGVFNSVTVGVTLDLPVRNKNQGAIEAAVAEAEGVKRRREFLELTVRREVASAYAQYNSTARAAEIFRVGVKDQANANLDVVRQTYELGSKSLIDYLGEQRRFIDLQNEYIDALLDTFKARVEVERAIGSPIASRQQVTRR